MELNDAILHTLNGDAILFVGAGFSYGAKNLENEDFLMGNGLCKKLIKIGKLEEDDDLAYISERFIEEYDEDTLIDVLKKQYLCKSYSEDHKTISNINWKRIYSTNYDNVIEKASLDNGKYRLPVVLSKNSRNIINKNDVVIHINGYIENLSTDSLYSEFKLTRDSYTNENLRESDWAFLLEDDLDNAKCIIFVGYSLEYDIDIQKLLATSKNLKDRCFFITHNPTRKTSHYMKKFGAICDIALSGFAEKIRQAFENYDPLDVNVDYTCFSEFDRSNLQVEKITDKDITKLLFNGIVNQNKLLKSDKEKYIIKRTCANNIVKQIQTKFDVIILHSDLGNGKTILIDYLKIVLSQTGKVFTFKNINRYLGNEIETINRLEGEKYIFIENYNMFLESKEMKTVMLHSNNKVKYIMTARSYINDNFYLKLLDKFKFDDCKVGIYDLNKLTDEEIKLIIELIDEYHLWGANAGLSIKEKEKILTEKCKSEMKSILLELFKSEVIRGKLNTLMSELNKNSEIMEISLLSFINSSLNLNLELNNILLMLNKQSVSARITKDNGINELFSLEDNQFKIKSPVVGYYILQNNDLTEEIVELLVNVMYNLDKSNYIDKYNEIMRLLISFSNLRIVLNKNSKNFSAYLISFYERIKNLEFNSRNPFFWLQYAIARMEIKDYREAKIYLENAYQYANGIKKFDTYQLDSHKARLLLEQTLYFNNKEEAYSSFIEAHQLIYNNNNKPVHLHYPLRQAKYYYDYYKIFYPGFDDSQKGIFLFCCKQIKDKIDEYNKALQKIGRDRSYEIIGLDKNINNIMREISVTINE